MRDGVMSPTARLLIERPIASVPEMAAALRPLEFWNLMMANFSSMFTTNVDSNKSPTTRYHFANLNSATVISADVILMVFFVTQQTRVVSCQ